MSSGELKSGSSGLAVVDEPVTMHHWHQPTPPTSIPLNHKLGLSFLFPLSFLFHPPPLLHVLWSCKPISSVIKPVLSNWMLWYPPARGLQMGFHFYRPVGIVRVKILFNDTSQFFVYIGSPKNGNFCQMMSIFQPNVESKRDEPNHLGCYFNPLLSQT